MVALKKRWDDHEVMVKWMQRFFQYLDRFYVEMNSITKLRDQGFKIFKEVLFKQIQENTTKAIVEVVDQQRKQLNCEVDDELLKGVIKIYLTLSQDQLAHDGWLPRVNLENALIEQTKKFYENRSREIMENTSLIEYLKIAEGHLEQEREKAERVFTWSVSKDIIKNCKNEMLIKPMETLMHKGEGLKEFLKQNQYDNIKLMYKLYREEPDCIKPITQTYKDYIIETGKEMLKQVETQNQGGKPMQIKEILDKSQIVTKLIDLLSNHLHIVNYCFEQNPSLEISRISGFENFVNIEVGQYSIAEMLSNYSDQVLRKNGFKAD